VRVEQVPDAGRFDYLAYVSLPRRLVTLVLVSPLALACGPVDDPQVGGILPVGGGGQGAGGAAAGGAGGQSSAESAKPVCEGVPGGGETPSARADTAGALSADGRTMVLFGGDDSMVVCPGVAVADHKGDTWTLDTACGTWTEITSPGPGARTRHVLVTDAARERALLYGGRYREGSSGDYDVLGDLWAFDFASASWTELDTSGDGPTPRSSAAATVVGDTLYLFGGNTSASGLSFVPRDELYALDLLTLEWREIVLDAPRPAARLFHAMTADPETGLLYVGGGGDANAFLGPFLSDTWSIDPATGVSVELDPGAGQPTLDRIKHGLSARRAAGEPLTLHAFAGHDDGALGNRNDVLVRGAEAGPWDAALEGDVYQSPALDQCDFPPDFVVADLASPERRSAFAFAPLPSGEAFVIFGGAGDCGRLADTWWFDTRAGTWAAVRESLVGLSCARVGDPSCDTLCN
jgi:hypothetical protein